MTAAASRAASDQRHVAIGVKSLKRSFSLSRKRAMVLVDTVAR
jgi:hypothetical protein